MTMKILIAPWGNPFSWKEVSYCFKGEKVKSKTSLFLLSKVLEPDRIWILVGDSLAGADGLPQCDYDVLVRSVEDKVKSFLKEGGFSLEKVKIFVLPGTGFFPNGSFEGQILDYYYCLLYCLATELVDAGLSEKLEVHLDLTHGLNFMPVLTYRALKEVLQVIALLHEVRFAAYNADPFFGDQPSCLHIHEVENVEVGHLIPTMSPFEVNESHKLFEKLVIEEQEAREGKSKVVALKSVDKSWVKDTLTFLGGGVFGLPLVLSTFFVPGENVRQKLDDALCAHRGKIENSCSPRLEVKRQARFTPLFRVLVIVYLVAQLLQDTVPNRKELSFDELKSLHQSLFKRNVLFNSAIGKEIKSMERIYRAPNSWRCWNALEGRTCGSLDRRNFFAHAGFEKNAVQFRSQNGELFLRYDPEKLTNIQNFILKALKSS